VYTSQVATIVSTYRHMPRRRGASAVRASVAAVRPTGSGE
jgi:hypothetical protein